MFMGSSFDPVIVIPNIYFQMLLMPAALNPTASFNYQDSGDVGQANSYGSPIHLRMSQQRFPIPISKSRTKRSIEPHACHQKASFVIYGYTASIYQIPEYFDEYIRLERAVNN